MVGELRSHRPNGTDTKNKWGTPATFSPQSQASVPCVPQSHHNLSLSGLEDPWVSISLPFGIVFGHQPLEEIPGLQNWEGKDLAAAKVKAQGKWG